MSTDKGNRASLAREIELPEGVTASLENQVLTINGSLGTCNKDFSSIRANISMNGSGKIKVEPLTPRKKDMATRGTAISIVKNMIRGVTTGFTYKLKVAFAHFPVTVRTRKDTVTLENFYGERNVRTAKIIRDTKVNVSGDDVIVQGINIEDVGQTAANIEQATRVKRKDQRVFLDGIYLYEKVKGA